MRILAIESSCDETAAAVIEERDKKPVVLSSIVSSQIDIHKNYGGVVPEVAARAHIESILPVIEEALAEADIKLEDIDYLAVTRGPGLIGSLVVGVETAKALSVATGIPLVPVNHLEGHLYAAFGGEIMNGDLRTSNQFQKLNNSDLSRNSKFEINNSEPKFPLLALLVSGGNTLLILMKDHLQYQVVGQTLDDAAGEAFDKAAKIMGLGYPGGPIISKMATEGDSNKYNLPIIDLTPKPKRDKDGYLVKPEPSLDFSFSGLKTALLTITKTQGPFSKKDLSDLAAAFERAVVETLVQNSSRAIKKYQPKTFVLAGGVAANPLLRKRLAETIVDNFSQTSYLIPPTSLCGDNAAMIGLAAYYKITKNPKLKTQNLNTVTAIPNLKIA